MVGFQESEGVNYTFVHINSKIVYRLLYYILYSLVNL